MVTCAITALAIVTINAKVEYARKTDALMHPPTFATFQNILILAGMTHFNVNLRLKTPISVLALLVAVIISAKAAIATSHLVEFAKKTLANAMRLQKYVYLICKNQETI